MKKHAMKIGIPFLVLAIIFTIAVGSHTSYAQQARWLRIVPLQGPVNELGAEFETEWNTGNADFFSWPAQYGIGQNTCRMRGMWIGCKDFDDPVANKVLSYKVIGVGPRDGSNRIGMIFPVKIKMIGRGPHPVLRVDDKAASDLDTYDVLDEVNPDLEADRVVLVNFNTSIGVSVTKKVMAFDQSNNDNYYINDWVFKNTGIYNAAGGVKQQTLTDVYFFFADRDAWAGVSNTGYGTGWGSWESTWGESNIIHSFGQDPTAPGFDMRGVICWTGADVKRTTLSYKEVWGNPAQDQDGQLASAKYWGSVILHADKSSKDTSDDLYQPRTNNFIQADMAPLNASADQYTESFMKSRYDVMSSGYPDIQHDAIVGGGYNDTYPTTYTYPGAASGGNVQTSVGFGPYTLAPGDSIHIVFTLGIAGISWEKGREVGGNWLQYYKNTGVTPTLILPDGSTTTDHNFYKYQWVATGKDSIMQTFRNAVRNYNSGYKILKAPPPPDVFSVNSGGDRIMLSWSSNADAAPHFDGYVVYRSRGNVLDRNTKYEKIFECSKSNVAHNFDDITAIRGFDYYYYIQSKDDGTQNDVHPGLPLYSSLFWTVTNQPATLQRPAVTGPPTSPAVDTTHWKQLVSKGTWVSGADYVPNDEVTFGALSYVCVKRDSGGKQTPDIDTTKSWKPEISKGAWVSGNGYAKYNVVSYNGVNYYCYSEVAQGSLLEQVRVVPNPYDIRARMFQFGDQSQYDRIAFFGLPGQCNLKIFTERGDLIWQKSHTNGTGDELWDSMTSSGQIIASGIYILYVEAPGVGSVFRKFVVIR
ncbi:MAG: hypothetical protein ABSB78_10275 [Bacteroidota bacterium]